MKNFFSPEDFDINHEYNERSEAARIANEKLNKLIESSPVVYAEKKDGFKTWHNVEFVGATHKAILISIEELPKVPCKHEPKEFEIRVEYSGGAYTPRLGAFDMRDLATIKSLVTEAECKHCGVKLEATWKEST